MRISEVWKTAFKAIGKNKRRSFLTMIGLIIGVSAVITVFSIGRAFEEYVSEFMGLNQVENKLSFDFSPKSENFTENGLNGFTEEDINRIESLPGVQSANYYIDQKYAAPNFSDIESSEQSAFFKLLKKTGTKTIYGRSIQESDYYNENPVVVINQKTAKAINKEVPESIIGQSIRLGGHLFEVVGIMKNREHGTILSTPENNVIAEIPKKAYEHYFKGTDYNSIDVKLRSGVKVKRVSQSIENNLKKYGTWKKLGSYKNQNSAMKKMVDQLRMILTGITLLVSVIGGISLFISGIGVMNMIYISVSERTKEIGVRRAMGGTKGNIMMQFLLEGITLTLFGGMIGFLVSILLGYVASSFTPLTVRPDSFTIGLAFGLSVVIGIVFSWLPAKSAAKKDIVTLLR
ncbi:MULTISPECIES: ABC transporter permease [Enterococcus]|uniref:ABC transporter permease n=1 Tax=Candidatus Enterococcus murrayae TaxID=2815321 RepID=A0ABS3HCJ6_9ENTE|nr:ABC transporter permease [Enterococcus sp. MJM16]MBO0451164.1 ABC transporter permease [Enterococcus sp. MJM16]